MVCMHTYTCITLHCIALHYVTLHYIAWHDMTWHDITLHTYMHTYIHTYIYIYIYTVYIPYICKYTCIYYIYYTIYIYIIYINIHVSVWMSVLVAIDFGTAFHRPLTKQTWLNMPVGFMLCQTPSAQQQSGWLVDEVQALLGPYWKTIMSFLKMTIVWIQIINLKLTMNWCVQNFNIHNSPSFEYV